jgi:NAD(P)-dependent dehydrogenase (short-subunit alcohol dehydrogenase family)
MLERGVGRIVNVASSVASRPAPYLSGYAAGKAALLNFTESLAAETADAGVRVFAVDPGRVATQMTDHMVSSDEGRRWLPHLQEGEWVDPDRAARLVVALASGRGDPLSGRLLRARDDFEEVEARMAEITRHDLYVSRLRT